MSHATVLAVGAHPDDVELSCAGTLVLLRERGFAIAIATMTAGDLGSASLDRREIARVRQEEARRAAALLGAEYRCLGADDFGIFFSDTLCRRATALLRDVRPTLVLTHPPADYLADHEETSRIVRQACFAASVPLYEVPSAAPPTSELPHLYYWDPVEGTDAFGREVPAGIIVDVTQAIDRKTEMLACHESQREWLRVQHGWDEYLDRMRAFAESRGRAAGFSFGEGFRQHLGHPFPSTDILGDHLGTLVRR